MYKHGFPREWSTLKKLIWLRGSPAMGENLPWAEFTGNPLTFNAPKAHTLKSVKVEFSPIQDLHGYANPWPAGGGVNKANVADYSQSFTNLYYIDKAIGVTLEAGVTYTFSCDVNSTVTPFNISAGVGSSGAYRKDILTKNSQVNGRVYITFTPTAEQLTDYTELYVRVPRFGTAQTGTVSVSKIQLAIGTETVFYPYSNLCPIEGWTGLDIYDDPAYGGTIRWNQLAENGNFADGTTDWYKRATDEFSASNNVLTFTAGSKSTYQYINQGGKSIEGGHKVLMLATVELSQAEKVGFGDGTAVITTFNMQANEKRKLGYITTWTAGRNSFYIYPARTAGLDIGETMKLENVMLLDLTAMFGAGNEPATVADFKALFPADYYPYNAGTVTTVSAVNGNPYKYAPVTFRTDTVNQWDEEWEVGLISSSTGANVADSSYIRSKNYCKCLPNTTYYVHIGDNHFIRMYWYDANKNFISSPTSQRDGTITTPSNCYYFRLVSVDATYGTTYKNDIAFNYPSTETAYHPYLTTVYGGHLRINRDGSVDLTAEGVKQSFNVVEGTLITDGISGDSFNKLNSVVAVLGNGITRFSFAVGSSTAINRNSSTYDLKQCNIAPHYFSYASETVHWYRNAVLYVFLPTALVGSTAESTFNYLVSIKDTEPLSFWVPLAEPQTIHLPSIDALKALKGINTMWTDGDELTVEAKGEAVNNA